MGEHSSFLLRTICDMDSIYGTFYKYVYNGKCGVIFELFKTALICHLQSVKPECL